MGFWRRARAFFADHGISVRAVLSDNGSCYRSQDWMQELVAGGAVPRRTRSYRPQTNGTVERSTAPCSTGGPTSASTPQKPNGADDSTAGSTPTTITAATPPSAASHGSPASTTCLGTATRAPETPSRVHA